MTFSKKYVLWYDKIAHTSKNNVTYKGWSKSSSSSLVTFYSSGLKIGTDIHRTFVYTRRKLYVDIFILNVHMTSEIMKDLVHRKGQNILKSIDKYVYSCSQDLSIMFSSILGNMLKRHETNNIIILLFKKQNIDVSIKYVTIQLLLKLLTNSSNHHYQHRAKLMKSTFKVYL